jgi:hypothetical protein
MSSAGVAPASACVYYSYAAQMYSWVHLIPWLVPFFIIAASFAKNDGIKNKDWGKQFMLVAYGLWLTLMQIVLYCLQYGLNIQVPDPYCPEIVSLAYPSAETFYTMSVITYVLCFTYCWHIIVPWFYWTCMFLIIVIEPYILFWFLYNDWYQTLVSMLLGIGATVVYFVIICKFVWHRLPILILQRPLTWFYAVDSQIMSQEQHFVSEYIEIKLRGLV